MYVELLKMRRFVYPSYILRPIESCPLNKSRTDLLREILRPYVGETLIIPQDVIQLPPTDSLTRRKLVYRCQCSNSNNLSVDCLVARKAIDELTCQA